MSELSEWYFIRRHGYFFRPRTSGYTGEISAAGVYSKHEAEKYLDVEDLTIHPYSEYRNRVESEIDRLQEELHNLENIRLKGESVYEDRN